MKRLKKCVIFFICIFTIFLISINVFVIFSHKKMSSQVENLALIKSQISELDSFKTIIVNLGHSQKFYLLSQDESYKVKYDNYLEDAYNSLDDLSQKNCINEGSKKNIKDMLKEYDAINVKLLDTKVSLPLSSDMQSYLAKSNEIQINIMHSISDAISSNQDSTSQSHSSLEVSVDNQKSFVQALSSITTVIIGGPLCYIIKKYKNGELKLDDIITILDKEKIKIDNYSNIILFASILNSHNKEMKNQWTEVKEKVESLQLSISDLKNTAANYNISILSDFTSEIQDMEIKLLEIRLLIKQLPNYHEFIVNLTDNIISTEKNK